MISDQGHILFWGSNKFGQGSLDPSTTPQVNTPMVLDQAKFGGEKVKVVSSGWTHMLAQTGNLCEIMI